MTVQHWCLSLTNSIEPTHPRTGEDTLVAARKTIQLARAAREHTIKQQQTDKKVLSTASTAFSVLKPLLTHAYAHAFANMHTKTHTPIRTHTNMH